VGLGLEAVKQGDRALLVYTAGAVFALTATMISASFAAQQPWLAGAAFVFGTLVAGLFGWLAARRQDGLLKYQWRVVQQPIRDEKLVRQMNEALSKFYQAARKAFEDAIPGVGDMVRANIFLPDFRRAADGVAFELRMTPQFTLKMTQSGERHASFQPGYGATGTAFVSGQAVVTLDRLYGIPESHKSVYNAQIARELKAILSLPIRDDKSVIAILNIDVCGDKPVSERQLNDVYENIRASRELTIIEDLLGQLKKAWLTITLASA
jgi:hypothetical protein